MIKRATLFSGVNLNAFCKDLEQHASKYKYRDKINMICLAACRLSSSIHSCPMFKNTYVRVQHTHSTHA